MEQVRDMKRGPSSYVATCLAQTLPKSFLPPRATYNPSFQPQSHVTWLQVLDSRGDTDPIHPLRRIVESLP